jgi:GAF domain-containing protein
MRKPAATDPEQDTTHFRRPMDDARLRIARLSPAHLELSEVFRQLCEIAADTLAVERAGIWLFVNHRTAIRCVCLFERSKRLFSEGATLRVADFPKYFAGLKVRKTIPAESAAHDPRTNELQDTYLGPLGISSMLDAPVLIDGEMQGVVCHEHVGPVREWSTEERDFAGSVADLVALKLKGAEIEKLRRIVRDLDADRAAQRQRESIASLAAGVAHDFRNLLVVINGYAQEIAFEASPDTKPAQHAREIMQTVERGSTLTTELLAIARDQGGQPQLPTSGE